MSQKMLAHGKSKIFCAPKCSSILRLQNRKIAILNRLSEITPQKQILDAIITKLDNSEMPVFDIFVEEK